MADSYWWQVTVDAAGRPIKVVRLQRRRPTRPTEPLVFYVAAPTEEVAIERASKVVERSYLARVRAERRKAGVCIDCGAQAQY